jgi:hypothetical protein
MRQRRAFPGGKQGGLGMHVQVICVNYADVPFAVHGTATAIANLRRARDPEVKRLCGGNVREPMARQGADCAACSRGA